MPRSDPAARALRAESGGRLTRALVTVALVATVGACASMAPRSATAVQPELARARALLSIGCYACLGEAAQIYERALSRASDNHELAEQAQLAYMLMAFRERELRLPDSGAHQKASALTVVSSLPADVFDLVLRALGEQHDPRGADSGATTDATEALVQLLAANSTRSLPAAYALATLACRTTAPPLDSASHTRWLAQMREQSMALRYAELKCSTSVPADEVDALLRADPRFAEVHYAAGVSELQHGRLLSAYEHFRVAGNEFTQSDIVTLALANVNLALARFDEALRLYERVLSSGERTAALLGRAKALTYLDRHREAIGVLDALLEDTEWNPGEKYYWRAWNLYRLSENDAAHRDVLGALRSWSSPHVQQLAGLTALALARYEEARAHFLRALSSNADDCESRLYLAQLDSHADAWDKALDGATVAAACFTQAIAERQDAKHEDATVVSRAREIVRLQRWRASSIYSAAISAKVLGRRELALDHARRLLDDPELAGLARDFIYDIDVPASPRHPSLIGPGFSGPPPVDGA
jgi:tetratricopeptide (TPR) repeat protein